MYILQYKNKNIICFPKTGCTTIIKLCTNTKEFEKHCHTFESNKCNKWGTIHKCGTKSKKYNSCFDTIIIYRYPHERIKSYFYSNYQAYKKNITFEIFVNQLLNNNFSNDNNIMGHLRPISYFNYSRFKNQKLIHLNNLNSFWLKEFNIDISKNIINNKGNYEKTEINIDLLNKIKIFYKKEYDFINSKTN
jgi:hypothetical protein